MKDLPFRLGTTSYIIPADILLVVAMALVICFLATIYPSRQAARLDPAQALRYE